MPVSFAIGLGGGLASALLFYSAARGSLLGGIVLLVLTPLPLLLAGLGWGWLPAAIGAVGGTLAVASVSAPGDVASYFLAIGLPVGLLSYLTHLSRPQAQDPDKREWYPAGRLVAALALYGGALPVLALPLIGGSYEFLRQPTGEAFRAFSARAPELGMKPLTQQQIEIFAEFVVAAVPAAFAAYWTALFTLNVYLAGRIAHASGRLGRDWPDLPAMTFPSGFPLLVALAIAASFVSGTVGIAGTSLSGALFFAYLLAGLALMHLIARGRGAWILWIVYAGLLVFGPYMALALTFAGLIEPVLKLGRRFGTSPPAT